MIEKIAKRMNYASATDLFAAIGFGDANAVSVAKRSRKNSRLDNVVDIQTLPRPRRRAASRAIPAASASPASTTCSCGSRSAVQPGARRSDHGLRDDRRGVSVHRADCPNVAYMNAAPERILKRRGPTRRTSSTRSTSRSKPATARACCKT
jgi:(p)ppGpp synthase/HD superfamily hydrolase